MKGTRIYETAICYAVEADECGKHLYAWSRSIVMGITLEHLRAKVMGAHGVGILGWAFAIWRNG